MLLPSGQLLALPASREDDDAVIAVLQDQGLTVTRS